jgi:hypothetical protein
LVPRSHVEADSLLHETSTFDALGFTFSVLAPDEAIRVHLDWLFRDCTTAGPAAHRYALRVATDQNVSEHHELTLDGRRVAIAPGAERLVASVVHDVNRRAVETSDDVILHAGGVERDGFGIVLPGVTEVGKTTLVAGLVRSGFGYLTDEAVAIERDTLCMRPYPKPLSLDPGCWPLFPELEPHADLATGDYKTEQWQVPPDAIRPRAVAGSCPVAAVVFPRYEQGADTALEQVGRGEALVELAKNTFKFKDQARDALDLLADLVRPARCYRLTTGELDQAVELISSLVGLTAHGTRAS